MRRTLNNQVQTLRVRHCAVATRFGGIYIKQREAERRTFSEEFKRDAVNLSVTEGCALSPTAHAIGVLDGSLREWDRKYVPEPESCG